MKLFDLIMLLLFFWVLHIIELLDWTFQAMSKLLSTTMNPPFICIYTNKNKPSNYYKILYFSERNKAMKCNNTFLRYFLQQFSRLHKNNYTIINVVEKILTIKPQRTRMKTITTWRKLRFSSPFKSHTHTAPRPNAL